MVTGVKLNLFIYVNAIAATMKRFAEAFSLMEREKAVVIVIK